MCGRLLGWSAGSRCGGWRWPVGWLLVGCRQSGVVGCSLLVGGWLVGWYCCGCAVYRCDLSAVCRQGGDGARVRVKSVYKLEFELKHLTLYNGEAN